MTDIEALYTKCRTCFKVDKDSIFSKCLFCRDRSLHEAVLCDLNRDAQSSADEFVCNASQPMLTLVSTERNQDFALAGKDNNQNDLFLSDSTKYNIALYLQKLGRDPNLIFAVLKYHVAWNVSQRENIFPESQDMIEPFLQIFKNPIKQVDTIVLPLWIASDHVHVYVETNGSRSIDDVIWKIKMATEKKLVRYLRSIDRKYPERPLWDDAYFVGSSGFVVHKLARFRFFDK